MDEKRKDYCGAVKELRLDDAVKEKMRTRMNPSMANCQKKHLFGNRGPLVVGFCVVVAVLVMWIAGFGSSWTGFFSGNGAMTVLAAAEYPKEASNEQSSRQHWRDAMAEYGHYSHELSQAMALFARDTASLVLGQSQENLCYSPISLYTALAMVAETAQGETRQEILQALYYEYPNGVMTGDLSVGIGAKEQPIPTLADDMYRYLLLSHQEYEISVSKIANSLWVDDEIPRRQMVQETLDTLAEKYRVTTFYGDLQSQDAAEAMSSWLLKQTKGLLGGTSQEDPSQETEHGTAMTLLSTVYYYDQWYDEFDSSCNVVDDFYQADGTVVQAEYMQVTHNPYGVLCRDGYTASSLSMKGGSKITFVLPDEGVTPAQILENEQWMAELLGIQEVEKEYVEVRFKIPKYHFQSETDLTEVVKTLGVTKAFSREEADFSGILSTEDDTAQKDQVETTNLWLSGIRQQTSTSIDEKGCEAAAYTRMDYAGAAMPVDGVVELTLNRPFLILIEKDGPLFIGVVNQP